MSGSDDVDYADLEGLTGGVAPERSDNEVRYSAVNVDEGPPVYASDDQLRANMDAAQQELGALAGIGNFPGAQWMRQQQRMDVERRRAIGASLSGRTPSISSFDSANFSDGGSLAEFAGAVPILEYRDKAWSPQKTQNSAIAGMNRKERLDHFKKRLASAQSTVQADALYNAQRAEYDFMLGQKQINEAQHRALLQQLQEEHQTLRQDGEVLSEHERAQMMLAGVELDVSGHAVHALNAKGLGKIGEISTETFAEVLNEMTVSYEGAESFSKETDANSSNQVSQQMLLAMFQKRTVFAQGQEALVRHSQANAILEKATNPETYWKLDANAQKVVIQAACAQKHFYTKSDDAGDQASIARVQDNLKAITREMDPTEKLAMVGVVAQYNKFQKGWFRSSRTQSIKGNFKLQRGELEGVIEAQKQAVQGAVDAINVKIREMTRHNSLSEMLSGDFYALTQAQKNEFAQEFEKLDQTMKQLQLTQRGLNELGNSSTNLTKAVVASMDAEQMETFAKSATMAGARKVEPYKAAIKHMNNMEQHKGVKESFKVFKSAFKKRAKEASKTVDKQSKAAQKAAQREEHLKGVTKESLKTMHVEKLNSLLGHASRYEEEIKHNRKRHLYRHVFSNSWNIMEAGRVDGLKSAIIRELQARGASGTYNPGMENDRLREVEMERLREEDARRVLDEGYEGAPHLGGDPLKSGGLPAGRRQAHGLVGGVTEERRAQQRAIERENQRRDPDSHKPTAFG